MGCVFQIQRCSVNDGPGIRTTVFLKGCPLRCAWCHNPESQCFHPQLMLPAGGCLHCGRCVDACPHGCHRFSAGGERGYNPAGCNACGRCAAACPQRQLALTGSRMTAEQVLEETLKDAAYFRSSGGGLTLSGGEPLGQPEFARDILRLAEAAGIHTALETCGYAPPQALLSVLPHTRLVLFDYKATGNEAHRRFTGVQQDEILENLARLQQLPCDVILRCPIVPGCNDNLHHFQGIAEISQRFPRLQAVELLPYHSMGVAKSQRLGVAQPSTFATPTQAQIEEWLVTLDRLGVRNLRLG